MLRIGEVSPQGNTWAAWSCASLEMLLMEILDIVPQQAFLGMRLVPCNPLAHYYASGWLLA